MKNLSLIIAAATLSSMLWSCQKAESENGLTNGEVEFSIAAGIPNEITTYGPEGTGSHNGGAVLLDPKDYDLRYVLEVWTNEQTPQLAYQETKYVPDNFTTQSVLFNVRLVAKNYNFVFWADFVPEGTSTDNYYNTSDLTHITYAKDPDLTDDAMDAYSKVVAVDLSSQNTNIQDVKLQRPFGKLRLIATDELSGSLQKDESPASTELRYADGTTIPDVFNALTGKASGNRSVSMMEASVQQEDATVNGTTYTDAYTLITNYIFASDAHTAYAMDITIKNTDNNTIGMRSLSQIPVVKNKLTTVIGNFYSNEGKLAIVVEDPFESPDITVDQH